MCEHDAPSESRESLWWIAASPATWLLHFVASYAIAALWCASRGRSAELGGARIAIGVAAGLAMVVFALVGARGFRRCRSGAPPYDRDTAADRSRFIGFATVLLSGLSAVATLYVTLTILFVSTCR